MTTDAPDPFDQPSKTYTVGPAHTLVQAWRLGQASSWIPTKKRWTEVVVYRIEKVDRVAAPTWGVEHLGRSSFAHEQTLRRWATGSSPEELLEAFRLATVPPVLLYVHRAALQAALERDPQLQSAVDLMEATR